MAVPDDGARDDDDHDGTDHDSDWRRSWQEPEGEDDMDTNDHSHSATSHINSNSYLPGSYAYYGNTFYNVASVADDRTKMQVLARAASAPTLPESAYDVTVVDADWHCSANPFAAVVVDIDEHIVRICSAFAKSHELLLNLPDVPVNVLGDVEQHALAAQPATDDSWWDLLSLWKRAHPYVGHPVICVLPDEYSFMIDTPTTSARSSCFSEVSVVRVRVHPALDLPFSGLSRATFVVPASMPIRILTATSIGQAHLNLMVEADFYTESDALDDQMAGDLDSNEVNFFVRLFRGADSPSVSDGEAMFEPFS